MKVEDKDLLIVSLINRVKGHGIKLVRLSLG